MKTIRKRPGHKSSLANCQYSLLDRLCQPDPADHRRQMPMPLDECIRRDLEMLLNTRARRKGLVTELNHVQHSIVNYGLADMVAQFPHDKQPCQHLTRELETAITIFEPRLSCARVSSISELKQHQRFHIDAVFCVDGKSEPLSFEAELRQGMFSVRILKTSP